MAKTLFSGFPVANGEEPTEGHARYCRENGHATRLVNGFPTGVCPRCGEVTSPVNFTAEQAAKFDNILRLEMNAKSDRLMAEAGMYPWDRERGARSLGTSQPRLFAAIDALTPEEARAFGEYRLNH